MAATSKNVQIHKNDKKQTNTSRRLRSLPVLVQQHKLKNISALDYDEIKNMSEEATMDVRNFLDQQEKLSNMINDTEL